MANANGNGAVLLAGLAWLATAPATQALMLANPSPRARSSRRSVR